jgi:hypothetical protein
MDGHKNIKDASETSDEKQNNLITIFISTPPGLYCRK